MLRLFTQALEIADAATNATDPDYKADLLNRDILARSRKHIADLRDFTVYCGLVEFLAKRIVGLVFQAAHVRTE